MILSANYGRGGSVNPALFRAIPAELRRKILQRDNHRCVYCGAETGGIDHVLPVIRGGGHHERNLVACCKQCNSSKGDKLPDEWKPDEWHRCDGNCEHDRTSPVTTID